MQIAVQHTGRLQGRPLKPAHEKRAELPAPLLFKLVILRCKSSTFHVFFSKAPVAVSRAVSHSAVWELQSVGANLEQRETCLGR